MYKKRRRRRAEGIKELQLSGTNGKEILDILINHLKVEHHYSLDKINELFRREEEIFLPDYIFKGKLSTLEAIVKYLKERLNIRYREISALLNRDERTIWVTYHKAKKKQKKPFIAGKTGVNIPISVFKNRKFSPLESLVFYLLHSLGMRNHEICMLLNKKPSTISTINARILKKQIK